MVLEAALRAFRDTLSRQLRQVLWKALGLTAGLFIVIFIAVQAALAMLIDIAWPWLETLIVVATGLGMLAALFFLMAPVTALFAGIYLDDIADLVERRHYRQDSPGTALPMAQAALIGARFGLVVLLVNLALLPMVLLGIGAIAMVLANAFLLGREYFELVAMRHMPADAARRLRKQNAPKVLVAGFVPALLVAVPLVNIVTPIFSTAYFVHVFKRVRAEAEDA
jgi:CysZ protein